jgi:hypothetical protein
LSRDVRQAIAGCASLTSAFGLPRHHLLIGRLQPFDPRADGCLGLQISACYGRTWHSRQVSGRIRGTEGRTGQSHCDTEYIKVYNEERRRLAREAGDQMSKLTRRNAEVSRELERLIDAVTQGVDLATLVSRIKALEAERSDIAGKLQCAGATDSVTLHPGAIEQYRADVEGLAALAAEHSDFAESAELIEALLRRLVAGVIVRAEPHGRGFSVEVQGRLAQLTNSALFPSRSEGGGLVVAGERYRLSPHDTNLRYFLRSSA